MGNCLAAKTNSNHLWESALWRNCIYPFLVSRSHSHQPSIHLFHFLTITLCSLFSPSVLFSLSLSLLSVFSLCACVSSQLSLSLSLSSPLCSRLTNYWWKGTSSVKAPLEPITVTLCHAQGSYIYGSPTIHIHLSAHSLCSHSHNHLTCRHNFTLWSTPADPLSTADCHRLTICCLQSQRLRTPLTINGMHLLARWALT